MRNSKNTQIPNSTPTTATEGKESKLVSTAVIDPKLKIDFCGFRASEKPCQIEIYLHNCNLHIDKDQISGYMHMRELAQEI